MVKDLILTYKVNHLGASALVGAPFLFKPFPPGVVYISEYSRKTDC